MESVSNLSSFQLDALREMAGIGASHAATSLSSLVSKRIHMTVPAIELCELQDLSEVVGGEDVVVGVYLGVKGVVEGNVFLMFPLSSARSLVDLMMMRPLGQTSDLGEMEQSALMEAGNILVSSFVDALATMLKGQLLPSPPQLVHDMAGAMVDFIAGDIGEVDDHAVIFSTEFEESSRIFNGYFILLPQPDSVPSIINQLGVEDM